MILTVTLNPSIDKTVRVDRLIPSRLNRIHSVRMDAGGKGINVAKVLKRFSAEVAAWGLTAGYAGRFLSQKLNELGIPSFFLEAEGETRTNLKVVDESTRETTELNEPGPTITPEVLKQFEDRFDRELPQASLVVLAGSLPPGVPPDYYGRLIEIAGRRGVKVILDADGDALAHGIEAVPYAIKPNIHELEKLCGRTLSSDEDVIRAADPLLAKGIRYVVVSMGGRGSLLLSKEERIRAAPFPIEPQSTVGAGDSMVAAMAFCILQGISLEQTARWATAAGTITASKPGTDVCTLQEVVEKLPFVQVERLT
jgi:1-phosphofructokinase